MEKITTLMSTTEFVLLKDKNGVSMHYQYEIQKYAVLMKTPFELSHFIPCIDGVPVEEPKRYKGFENIYQKFEPHELADWRNERWYYDCKDFKKAKEACLFVGWRLKDTKKTMSLRIVHNEDFEINIDTLSCGQYVEGGFLDGQLIGNTIEAVANIFKGITLSPTAVKQIYNS